MESGYNVHLDRTCYNITYYTESASVQPGTVLFGIKIFIESGVSGLVAVFLPGGVMEFSERESGFTFTALNSPTVTIHSIDIVAGQYSPELGVNNDLTFDTYTATITVAVPPPLIDYEVVLNIISKPFLQMYQFFILLLNCRSMCWC